MHDFQSDEDLEIYLKTFRPLAAPPLRRRTLRGILLQPSFRVAICATASVLLFATVLLFDLKATFSGEHRVIQKEGLHETRVVPLTLQEADLLLASGAPYKDLVEDLAKPLQIPMLPPQGQRAFAVLADQKGLR